MGVGACSYVHNPHYLHADDYLKKYSALKWGRCNENARTRIGGVGCGCYVRKFHDLLTAKKIKSPQRWTMIPINDENEQDRSDVSSTVVNRYLSTVITNTITFIQNPINYSMGSPISKQPTQA